MSRIQNFGLPIKKESDMDYNKEQLINRNVTYTLELRGKVYLVENVPARVNNETGEQFFSPETVERLQKIISGKSDPERFISAPVYNYGEVIGN